MRMTDAEGDKESKDRGRGIERERRIGERLKTSCMRTERSKRND